MTVNVTAARKVLLIARDNFAFNASQPMTGTAKAKKATGPLAINPR